jgi:transcriptional regulator with XRE-family HTH domain
VPEPELREKVCSQVATLLRELREERGLSMTALAAQAGLSRAMISHVEHGLRNPTVDTLLRIAAVLKVDASEILQRAEAGASKKGRS